MPLLPALYPARDKPDASAVRVHNFKAFRPSIRPLIEQVCLTGFADADGKVHLISPVDLVSASRKSRLARARHIISWAAARNLPISYPQIGRQLGDRDHTSIIYGAQLTAYILGLEDFVGPRRWHRDVEIACAMPEAEWNALRAEYNRLHRKKPDRLKEKARSLFRSGLDSVEIAKRLNRSRRMYLTEADVMRMLVGMRP